MTMAVLIEAISVVIRIETIADKYPGGVEQYINDCPNRTLCMDDEIVRVGFMSSVDAQDYVGSLHRLGLRCLEDDDFDEIAVVDQDDGIIRPCEWLRFAKVVIFEGDLRISICQVNGSEMHSIAFPAGWNYEHSLSKRTMVIDSENGDSRMVFLRHENGLDCFQDRLTGEKVWVGRTVRRNLNA